MFSWRETRRFGSSWKAGVDVDVAVLVDLEVVLLEPQRAVLAEDAIAFLGLEPALLAEDEGAVSRIAFAVGRLDADEALAVEGEVEVALRLFEGALFLLGEELVGLHARAQAADDGGRVRRAKGVEGDPVIAHGRRRSSAKALWTATSRL